MDGDAPLTQKARLQQKKTARKRPKLSVPHKAPLIVAGVFLRGIGVILSVVMTGKFRATIRAAAESNMELTESLAIF